MANICEGAYQKTLLPEGHDKSDTSLLLDTIYIVGACPFANRARWHRQPQRTQAIETPTLHLRGGANTQ
eukprot:6176499-Pleurochrysis_carterae.AAC.1